MKETFAKAATILRTFALERGLEAEFSFYKGAGRLVRFANSGVSANTGEDVFELSVTVRKGRATGSYTVQTSLSDEAAMKVAVLKAAEIAEVATPVNYDRRTPVLPERMPDDANFDHRLENFTTAEALELVGRSTDDLLEEGLSLSGMVSTGTIYEARANTLNNVLLYHAGTDANMELVISSDKEKWEIQSTQSAVKAGQFAPEAVREELALLLKHYKESPRIRVETGKYDVVLGRSALADLFGYFLWVGFNGGSLRRDMSFLKEEDLGKQVFSPLFSVYDDPSFAETFPYAFDENGLQRSPYSFVKEGVFQNFFWPKDIVEEFGGTASGHDVPHMSIAIGSGNTPVNSLAEVLAMPREKDMLYLPYLHYMGLVNAAKGVVTGSTRFGALYLHKDGRISVPYNMRFTTCLRELFSSIEWISQRRAAVNVSSLYGRRNPEALLVPRFTCFKDFEIILANDKF